MATIKKQLTLTFKQPNIAESYGPYISVSAAHAALSEDQLNVIGMTVGIQTDNTIEEYWYQGGTNQENLVKKQTAVEVDVIPTQSSSNAVSSGGVYNALQGKANTSDIPTISTNITTDATSDAKTASPKAVKTYVDNGLTGKQNTISASNTINSDFVDDTNGTNKFVTSTEKGLIGTAIQGIKKGTETLTPVNGVVTIPSDIEGAQAISVQSNQSATATIDSNHVLQLEIPRGADAVNPFKGWFNAVVTGEAGSRVITSETQNLPSNPIAGDYAYVKTWEITGTAPDQVETPIVKIYECTTVGSWSDSGRTADTSNVQTFASSQEVNEVHIVNDLTTGGVDDVLSAEQGKKLKKEKLDKDSDSDTFYITDSNNNVICQIDAEGIHSVNYTYKDVTDSLADENGNVSLIAKLTSILIAISEKQDTLTFDNTPTAESNNPVKSGGIKTSLDAKFDKEISDNSLIITDSNGYIICKIDADGVHAPNIQDNGGNIVLNNDSLVVTDPNGYIVFKVDNNGIHSVVDKHAVACMVLSENYYPTQTPTRDGNGNVTHAVVTFYTGVSGTIDITYTNGNASSASVVYGSYTYTITINRDYNGNVTTVSVTEQTE